MLQGITSRLRGNLLFERLARLSIAQRAISSSSPTCSRKMPDRPPPPLEGEFTESFLKGSGPGGQKINKTSSAVQLRHIPTGIVLKVQATRSRSQNRKIAREMLAERIEKLEKGRESRIAVVGETKRKRKSSATKKTKRKYRALEEAKKTSNPTGEHSREGGEGDDTG